MLARLKLRARLLKSDLYALFLASRDPRTPLYAKVFTGAVLLYALSPFDLIPDFIPVLGYLDDLVLVPAGIAIAIRLIPADVLIDSRRRAVDTLRLPTSLFGAALMVVVWVAAALAVCIWVINQLV